MDDSRNVFEHSLSLALYLTWDGYGPGMAVLHEGMPPETCGKVFIFYYGRPLDFPRSGPIEGPRSVKTAQHSATAVTRSGEAIRSDC